MPLKSQTKNFEGHLTCKSKTESTTGLQFHNNHVYKHIPIANR